MSRAVLEEAADTLFGASRRLAVYGSLAPGASNHHAVEGLRGEWTSGFVRGELYRVGGFPAVRLDPGGSRVEVMVLTSPDLPGAWPRLDRFEGPAYRRRLTLVEDDSGPTAVANIYAGRRPGPTRTGRA